MADTVTKGQEIAAAAKRRFRAGEFGSYQDAVTAVTAEAAGDPTIEGVTPPPTDEDMYEDNPQGDPDTTARNRARLAAAAAAPGAITISAQAQAPDTASPAPDNDQATQQETPTVADDKPAKAPKPAVVKTPKPVVGDASTTKQCSVCGETYPATSEHFKVKTANADGLNERCKTCSNAYHTARNAVQASDADPENADKLAKAATAAEAWNARKALGVGRLPVKAPRAVKADAAPVDATAQQAAELADLERRVAAAGGESTEEGQAILADAAAKAAEARKAATPRKVTTRQALSAKTQAKAEAGATPTRAITPAPKPSAAKRTSKAAKAK